jgi:hypothetical protein
MFKLQSMLMATLGLSLAPFAAAQTSATCETLGNVYTDTNPTYAHCLPPSQNFGYTRIEGADARAFYGLLGVSGEAELYPAPLGTIGGAASAFQSYATFQDTFVVHAPVSTGFLEIDDSVTGLAGLLGTGSYTGSAEVYLEILSPYYGDHDFLVGEGSTSITADIPFYSNSPSYIYFRLFSEAGCEAYGNSSCNIFTNYLDTSRVTGYTVLDQSGNPIDASVVFGSGTDYNSISDDNRPSPVPEPSTIIMIVTGLAGVANVIRSRQIAVAQT